MQRSPVDPMPWNASNATASISQTNKMWYGPKQGTGNTTKNTMMPLNRGIKVGLSFNNNYRKNTNCMLLPKDITDDTYEVGIAKDMRELQLRLESELEEQEKSWSHTDEPTKTQNKIF